MINSISGRLLDVRNQSLILSPWGETPSIELEVLAPAYWAEGARDVIGQVVRAHTRLHLESQNQGASFIPRLIGFPTPEDRAFFELFTSVKGLGNRKALRAMAVEPGVIAGAIAARDAKALTKLPEIGKRLAETIIAELHGKLGSVSVEHAEAAPPVKAASGPEEEAIAALVALGQTRSEAEQAVAKAMRGETGGWTTEQLIARAFAG